MSTTMENETEKYHSRLLWDLFHFDKDGADEWMVVTSGEVKRTIALANTTDHRQSKADMELIVTAVNERSVLLERIAKLEEALRSLRTAAEFSLSTPGLIRGRDQLKNAMERAALSESKTKEGEREA